jgi:hypothetical protein
LEPLARLLGGWLHGDEVGFGGVEDVVDAHVVLRLTAEYLC